MSPVTKDHDGDRHRVADRLPCRIPLQPGPAVPGADRGGGAVRGPPGLHLSCSAESWSISRSSAK